MAKRNIDKAKEAKKDEFYTQLHYCPVKVDK